MDKRQHQHKSAFEHNNTVDTKITKLAKGRNMKTQVLSSPTSLTALHSHTMLSLILPRPLTSKVHSKQRVVFGQRLDNILGSFFSDTVAWVHRTVSANQHRATLLLFLLPFSVCFVPLPFDSRTHKNVHPYPSCHPHSQPNTSLTQYHALTNTDTGSRQWAQI